MNADPRIHWLLGLVLAVGFVLRLTYLLEVRQAPDFDAPQFESQYHDYWARALVTGDWTPPAGVTDPEIPERPYFRPPGYPWFLATVYGVFGTGYLVPRVVQMIFGLLGCALLFALGKHWDGAATGLFAAGLAAIYWIFVFFEGEFMEPPLLIVLFLVTLWTLARWADAWTLRSAIGAGLALGFAVLVRPNAVVLLPVFLLWAVRTSRRRGLAASGIWKPAAVFVAVTLLTTLPATVRNLLVADDPVWITSNAGVNLFVGSHPDGDGFTPGVAELGEISGLEGWDSFDHPKIAAAVERLEGRQMTDSEVSRFFVRRAIANVAEDPWRVLALTARKLALFWGPSEVSNNKVLFYERRSSPTLSLGPSFATVLALSLAGLAWVAFEPRRQPRGRRREVTVLLVLFVAAYSASFLPFFVAARFRAPVLPVLMLFAGAALSRTWRAVRARRWTRVGAVVLVFAAVRVAAGVQWIPYEDDLALWHWRQGLLYEARGDLGQAIDEYRDCLAAEPDHGDARLALAGALSASGQPVAARDEYRAALARDPASITAHNNLAMLLAGAGDVAAAIRHWQAALEIDPDRVSVLGNLAFALATGENPDPERAVELAERGCRLTGYRDPRLLAALASARRAAGAPHPLPLSLPPSAPTQGEGKG
ncbi:MAG: glycosyltransferase family 39 protein [Thermoanaerobaculia bacterium]